MNAYRDLSIYPSGAENWHFIVLRVTWDSQGLESNRKEPVLKQEPWPNLKIFTFKEPFIKEPKPKPEPRTSKKILTFGSKNS